MNTAAFNIPLRYFTLKESENHIDAAELGRSLVGVSRMSNIVGHFLLIGEIPKRRTILHVRFYAGPPQPGSIWYDFVAVLGVAQAPIWWPLFSSIAEPLFKYLISAIISAKIGRKSEVDRMIDLMGKMVEADDRYRTLVQGDHMQDKEWMKKLIDRLADRADKSMRDAAAPVGRSGGPIEIGDPAAGGLRIDEASAMALRAEENLVVGDLQPWNVKFLGVDKTRKNGRVELIDSEGQQLNVKITDPSLQFPENVYTKALDLAVPTQVMAKPILKDGAITTLFISDGKIEGG